MTTTLPPRVRPSRAKGYRLQTAHPGAIVVTRPGHPAARHHYGNPFHVTQALTDDPTLTTTQARQRCAGLYRLWLDGEIYVNDPAEVQRRQWILDHLHPLAGHPLACWCPLPQPGQPDHCHAAALLSHVLAERLAGRTDHARSLLLAVADGMELIDEHEAEQAASNRQQTARNQHEQPPRLQR